MVEQCEKKESFYSVQWFDNKRGFGLVTDSDTQCSRIFHRKELFMLSQCNCRNLIKGEKLLKIRGENLFDEWDII